MKLKLEPHEVNSALWQKLETHYKLKLTEARNRFESRGCAPDDSIRLREKINTIKEFLAMANPERDKRETDAD